MVLLLRLRAQVRLSLYSWATPSWPRARRAEALGYFAFASFIEYISLACWQSERTTASRKWIRFEWGAIGSAVAKQFYLINVNSCLFQVASIFRCVELHHFRSKFQSTFYSGLALTKPFWDHRSFVVRVNYGPKNFDNIILKWRDHNSAELKNNYGPWQLPLITWL